MRIDFDLVRNLLLRAAKEAPLMIEPLSAIITGLDPEDGPFTGCTILTPKNEGDEFLHWKWMAEEQLIRVSHDGRPGFGKLATKVERLLSKGHELVELSLDEDAWQRALRR